MFQKLLRRAPAALLLAALVPSTSTVAAHREVLAAPLPSVTAQLAITFEGNGYYRVSVSGFSSARNATLGVRVYGEDTWFDDLLFSMGSFSRTGPDGYYSVSQLVHRNTLNEDFEGADEIYAIASVTGGGSVRSNKITRSF